jgi:hypothetical protein
MKRPALRCRRAIRGRLAKDYRGFMYQKIASATRATVIIHRMTSLLRLFSSAMQSSTPHLNSRFKCRVESLSDSAKRRLAIE